MRSNQKGYSLVEAVVAIGIAGIVAVSVMSAFPFLRKISNRGRATGACRAYLDAAFGRLEQEGFRGTYDPTIPKTTTTVPSKTLFGFELQPWSQGAPLPLIGFTNSDEFTQLRTAGLITSSVALVNALYRTEATSTICSASMSMDGSTVSAFLPQPPIDMHDPTDDSLHNFALELTVKPYDLHLSRVRDCSTDPGFSYADSAIPVPKGKVIGAPGNAAESRLSRTEAEGSGTIGLATYPKARQVHTGSATNYVAGSSTAMARNNLGFEVRIAVTFVTKDVTDTSGASDKAQACEESRIISYAADLTAPAAPTITPSLVLDPYNFLDYYPASVSMTFAYTGEPATVLMCRDYSDLMVPYPTVLHPGKAYVTPPATPGDRWVPCEKVTVCGIAENSAPTFTGTTGDSYSITKTWAQKVPYGCRAKIEAVAVDAAGNVSASATLGAGFNINDP